MKKLFNGLIIYISTCLLAVIIISILIEKTSIFKKKKITNIEFLQDNSNWADSLIATMSIDEKIAQMLIFKVEKDSFPDDSINLLIEKNIGGILLSTNNFEKKLYISNAFQNKSKYPAFIGISESQKSPNFQTFKTLKDSTLLFNYFNDVSENAAYYGINIKSLYNLNVFKSDIYESKLFNDSISRRGVGNILSTYYNSVNSNKMITYLEDFDTYLDFSKDSLKNYENILFNYKNICTQGLSAIIFSKLTLSDTLTKLLPINHLKDYMEKYLGFYGLNISEKFILINSQTSLDETVRAGIEIVIIKDSIQETIDRFKYLISSNLISEDEVNKRVKKILMAKKWINTKKIDSASIQKLIVEEKKTKNQLFLRQIYENSIVLVRNKNYVIPFNDIKFKNYVTVFIGNENIPELIENMQFYSTVFEKTCINISDFKANDFNSYSSVIVVLNNFKTDTVADSLFFKEISILDKKKNIILINYSNPENLNNFDNIETMIQVFDNQKILNEVLGQYLFGGFFSDAELPFTVSNKFPIGTHADYKSIKRFKYTIPEDAGMSSDKLQTIDSIIQDGINNGAFPGCEVLVAKDSKVIYYKAFGKQTYSDFRPVIRTDIYDLASITKVAATTLLAMNLYERNVYKLDDSVKYYLEDTINLTFKNHQIKDFLLHQTGIAANMPVGIYIIYKNSSSEIYKTFFSSKKDTIHTLEVSDNFWFNKNYIDSIYYDIFTSEIDTTKPYIYSDVNFNILYKILTPYISSSFDKYLYTNFYEPLGLQTMGFKPLERFNENRIAPTQNDKYWRNQLLQGYVHDESAALNGGVWGNAGLFSNSNDLAILFQMLLNGGVYAGNRYLNLSTIELFTSSSENSKRGLGFNLNDYSSFGHTGFTGTCVWASKKYNIVYVFLSNRIYPKMTNNKLQEMEIRQKIYDVIINSIESEN